MMIDKETYKINPENYYKTKYKKKQIILAGSNRKENFHIKRFQSKEYGKTKKWCTYTISRDGKIYQHYDPKFYTDFMGIKDIDKYAVSIVLENMGSVFYSRKLENYINWANDICPEEMIFEKPWKEKRYWEIYTEEQFHATVWLCEYLIEKLEIKRDCIGYNSFFDGTMKFEGIVSRSNFDADYLDLNPSFHFAGFLKELDIDY